MTEQPPSPDTPPAEPLELVDFGNEFDLAATAIDYAKAALPEWQPREGNTEVVLIESLAMMLGIEVLAIQLLPDRILDLLMSLYGVTRDGGSPAQGRVTFTVTASNPTQVIPAGTRLRYQLQATGETIDVFTVEPLSIITTETTTGSVNVTATQSGIEANGVPAGSALDVVDNLTFVNTATLTEQLAGGTGPEDDSTFYSRASASLARLNSTLVLPEQFQYAALSQPGIGRAKVFDRYDPAAPEIVSAGHVTVAVADKAGQPLLTETAEDLQAWIAAQALASLQIHIIEPTYTAVDLAVTVQANSGADKTAVRASVVAALESWLSPTLWEFTPEVAEYAVVSIVSGVPGVARVTLAPATIQLPGKAPLPTAGVIDVTVL